MSQPGGSAAYALVLLACCGDRQLTVPLGALGEVPTFAVRIENRRESIERIDSDSSVRWSLYPGDSVHLIAVDPSVVARQTPYFDELRGDEVELVLDSPPSCLGGEISRDRTQILLPAPGELRLISVDDSGEGSAPKSLAEVPDFAGRLGLKVPASFRSCAGDRPFSVEQVGALAPDGPAAEALGPMSDMRGLINLEDGRTIAITWFEAVLIEPDGRVPDDRAHVRPFNSGAGEIFGAAIHPPGSDGARIVTVVGFGADGKGVARDVALTETGFEEISTATVAPTAFRGVYVVDDTTYLLEERGRIWKRVSRGAFRVLGTELSEMYRLGSTGSANRPHVVLGRDGHAFEGDLAIERWWELDNPKTIGVNLWDYVRLAGDEVWLGASKGLIFGQRPGQAWSRVNLRVPSDIESCTPLDQCGWSDLPLTIHSLTALGRAHVVVTVEGCDHFVVARVADRCTVVSDVEATKLSISEQAREGAALVGGSGGSIYRVTE
ncbi:MAG: hypothetical protein HY791_04855 [Deltaproteobacteria bacterium]|nr:hypothetical protein [Deltaproteobacteria bacterium]